MALGFALQDAARAPWVLAHGDIQGWCSTLVDTELEEVFSRLAARGHSLKPSKVKLLQQDVEYLGHISTQGGVKITPGQRKAILAMPYPVNEDGP